MTLQDVYFPILTKASGKRMKWKAKYCHCKKLSKIIKVTCKSILTLI